MKRLSHLWYYFGVVLTSQVFFPALALATDLDENSIPTAIKRALNIGLWGGIGFLTVVGLVAFGLGMMKMWNTDDPRKKEGAIKQIVWGGMLSFAMLVIVAVRLFVFEGDKAVTAEDLTGVAGQTQWDQMFGQ